MLPFCLVMSEVFMGLPRWLSGKRIYLRRHRRCRFNPWVRRISWRRKWQPIQHSCLETPMNRGAWQAAVHGILKELDTTEQLSMHEVSDHLHRVKQPDVCDKALFHQVKDQTLFSNLLLFTFFIALHLSGILDGREHEIKI